MKRKLLVHGLAAISLYSAAFAQTPIIVQPANQAAATPQPSIAAKGDDTEMQEAIKSLQQMKAGNDDLLQKQQALLEALDELQKQAEQMRIYSKRS
ncbi:MAG: hypothetical protein JO354_12395 [Verrucomicrobia bacterium]|nr:hypothetical protein [Verrucomicrobiota bacterium]